MAADIFTKSFVCPDTWFHAISLIGTVVDSKVATLAGGHGYGSYSPENGKSQTGGSQIEKSQAGGFPAGKPQAGGFPAGGVEQKVYTK